MSIVRVKEENGKFKFFSYHNDGSTQYLDNSTGYSQKLLRNIYKETYDSVGHKYKDFNSLMPEYDKLPLNEQLVHYETVVHWDKCKNIGLEKILKKNE